MASPSRLLPRLPLNELPEQGFLLLRGEHGVPGVERPLDLDDVVLIEPNDLDDRARRVGPLNYGDTLPIAPISR